MTPALSLTGDGVRHAGDRGEAAGDRRRGAGRDRLLVLLPRLAQVHVHVDQPGQTTSRPGTLERPSRAVGRQIAADPRDAVVRRSARRTRRRVRSPDRRPVRPSAAASSPRSAPHPPASRYSTAIRTATPLATCSRITEYGPSATSDAISTPRFIGPGCMMITSGLARRTPRRGHAEHVEVLAQRREEARPASAPAGCAAS